MKPNPRSLTIFLMVPVATWVLPIAAGSAPARSLALGLGLRDPRGVPAELRLLGRRRVPIPVRRLLVVRAPGAGLEERLRRALIHDAEQHDTLLVPAWKTAPSHFTSSNAAPARGDPKWRSRRGLLYQALRTPTTREAPDRSGTARIAPPSGASIAATSAACGGSHSKNAAPSAAGTRGKPAAACRTSARPSCPARTATRGS